MNPQQYFIDVQNVILNGEKDKNIYVHLVRDIAPSAQPERLTDYSFEESCTDCPAYDTENHRCPRFNQVIRRALKDANLEPCEDCISRQAAIDALRKEYGGIKNANMDGDFLADEIEFVLSKLPSAQLEIIRCKDCRWYKKERGWNGIEYTVCKLSRPIRKEDDFCSRAERRTDE